ncbi:MAG TPA: rhomboid family intramembrane serine protease, partial [Planctomycetota bacterium]|nr:rhomboid family intramembrane serine protease [Planctomycetota bacterium]
MTQPDGPSGPERNLLRALHPATTEIHKALQRLLLKSGGEYRIAPQVHDYDTRPYVMTNPLRELGVKSVLVFPWDTGTGQTLAEFVAYYKTEIPRHAPLTIVITASPVDPKDLALAEGVLESPVCVLSLVKSDPNRLEWRGKTPFPPAIDALDDKRVREALREIDPADAIEGFQKAQPKDASRSIESNLVMPRRPSSYYSYSLILINVAVYILSVVKAMKITGQLDWDAGAVLVDLGLNERVAVGEWWRLFSCGWLHIGPLHLLMNMYFLFSYGPVAESTFGRNRFLVLYLLSLFGCSALSFAWHVSLGGPFLSAGASGALMGIFFGITGYVVAVRKVIGTGRVKELVKGSLKYAAFLFILGLFMRMDNAGHLGGGLAGFGVGFCFGMQEPLLPRWLVQLKY